MTGGSCCAYMIRFNAHSVGTAIEVNATKVLLRRILGITTSAEHNSTVQVPGCQDEIIVMYSLTNLKYKPLSIITKCEMQHTCTYSECRFLSSTLA
jgi:hypothetical protein